MRLPWVSYFQGFHGFTGFHGFKGPMVSEVSLFRGFHHSCCPSGRAYKVGLVTQPLSQDGVVHGSSVSFERCLRDCFSEFWVKWKRFCSSPSPGYHEYIRALHQDKSAVRKYQPSRYTM